MKKIFCVEDDANIREIVEYTLKSTGFEAYGFETAKDFFKALKKDTPSLVLLDIMLPDMDGIEILKLLKNDSNTKDIPVILLTAKSGQLDKIKGLDSGADDYVTKPFDVLELISRIKAILRRLNKSDDKKDTFSHKKLTLDLKRRLVTVDSEQISLTFKEFELLALLLQNKGIVIPREKIMNDIWGTDFCGETRTVDVHIRTLRQKLGDCGREYIETIRHIGYKIG